MSTPVYLAGRALASTLGANLAQALRQLNAPPAPPSRFEVAPGVEVPYHAIAGANEPWTGRAGRLVRQVAAECGAEVATREGALFVATTSFDMGAREADPQFEGDTLALGERVRAWLGWRGPVFTVSTACTSSLTALLSARALLQAGDAEEALVLGFELANRLTLGGFQAMQLLAPCAARPLAADRSGMVLGEAVAALRLTRRPGRWRLRGGANVTDPRDPAGAAVEAVQAMARRALEDAGLPPQAVHLLKLQAAGSPGNDAVEIEGLRRVFDPLPPLLTLKDRLGHTLGAAGAAEIALLLECLDRGTWPAQARATDPALALTLADRAPAGLRHLLAVVLAFGGGHAAVLLEDMDASERHD